MKRWQWFTFCFVPVVPFSIKPYKEVGCSVCNFWQDIKYRPDVVAQIDGAAGGGAVMMGGVNGGNAGGAPGAQVYAGPPQGGVPQYK